MTRLEDLAFLVVHLPIDFWKHLVELLTFVEVWRTKLNKLNISGSLVTTLDKTLYTRDQIFDIFKIVLVCIAAFLPLLLFFA